MKIMKCMKILLTTFVLIILLSETRLSESDGNLVLDYYKETCPMVEEIVQRQVQIAVLKNPRMAASLLRLHFHDCFVMVSIFLFSTYQLSLIVVVIKLLLVNYLMTRSRVIAWKDLSSYPV